MKEDKLHSSGRVRDLRKQSYEDAISDSLKGAEPVDTTERQHTERRVRGLARKMANDIGNQGAREYLAQAYEDDDERIGWVIDELNKHGAEFSRGGHVFRATRKHLDNPLGFDRSIEMKIKKDKYLSKRAL